MAYFVTGGTSSIGKVLVKELAEKGENIHVLVRKKSNISDITLTGVEFVYGDVTDLDSVQNGMKGCSRVCHLASVVGSNVPEEQWWKVNKEGARNVLDAAVKLDVQSVVQVSSISSLLPTKPGEIADETRSINTAEYFNIYQKTKHAADELAREAYANLGLNVKIVYPGYGYGFSFASSHPGMTDQTLIRMASGKPVAIMGSGKNHLLVSYYKDTSKGILLAHDNGIAGDDYILGNDNLTLPEMWQVIAEILGKEPPTRRMPIGMLKTINLIQKIIHGKAPFPQDFFDMVDRDWHFSFEKARRVLKFQPRSFKETMMETWEEYNTSKK